MFVHLHVHTEYSLLDGAARIKETVKAAREMGMPALAITDHGAMFGVVDFYKACQGEGIKPIIGCEVYVAPRSRFDRVPHIDDDLFHLVLLAENDQGYRNLMKIVSLAYIEGFYYKPRVDKELLATYHEGLIALSACLAGEVPTYLLRGEKQKALMAAAQYRDIFGRDNFFIELQDHGLVEQRKVNPQLIQLAAGLNIPLVATNDVHYLRREHADIQDVLLCIQTGKAVDDPGRMRFDSDQFYLKTPQEMATLFQEVPEAIRNTLAIAERCQVELSFGKLHLPEFEVPAGHTVDSYLEEKCWEGMRWRYGDNPPPEAVERLKFELAVIRQMGYSAYFLIVWDFVHFARRNGIPVGPGRGSAAGSLVAYVLGITNIEPIRYGLLFERFLNPERVSMPDIDIDFCFERRGEVLNYVVQRYGVDRVAQIATFGTMAARAAVRDVGRALNFPYSEVDRVAKLIPPELHMTIERALQESPELRELYERDAKVRRLLDTAALLQGMPRHASTHAAGVVITREPLTEYLPLYKAPDGPVTTQFAKDQVEELGLLKMDLLGLRTLTVINDTLRLIRENGGPDIDIDRIPLDDTATYQLLGRGEGVGVFQLESSGMRAILKELKPEVFEDIVALVALYRPGPLGSGMVDDFIKSKHGLKEVTYLHPKLEPILRDTYGVILYQEQVMRIARDLAGFTLGQADLMRRAMGKKKPEIIAGLRQEFIEGAVKNGVEAEVAGQIFDLMEYFAGYGFNKSHSAAYALVAYQTAYLKANYPVEYMTALLTSVQDNTDKVAVYIEECRRMGIEVLPPDINESRENFTVVGNKIRFGLAAIKNVGLTAVESILRSRDEEGPFRSFTDFLRRVDTKVINRRVLENLIKSGAFDSLGCKRAQLMAAVDLAISYAQQVQKEKMSEQLSLFDFCEGLDESCYALELPDVAEYAPDMLLALEKEVLGLYISGHPLHAYRETLLEAGITPVGEIKEWDLNQAELKEAEVVVGGIISGLKRLKTRRDESMAFATLEDLTGTVEVVFFPRVYREFRDYLLPDTAVLVRGRVSSGSNDEVKIIAESVKPLVRKLRGELYIKLNDCRREVISEVQALLQAYPGDCPVYLYFPREKKLFRTAPSFWVDLSGPVCVHLQKLVGKDNVKVKTS